MSKKGIKEVNITAVNENTFTIVADAAISHGLVRWLLTWGSDVKVIAPDNLKEKIMLEIK